MFIFPIANPRNAAFLLSHERLKQATSTHHTLRLLLIPFLQNRWNRLALSWTKPIMDKSTIQYSWNLHHSMTFIKSLFLAILHRNITNLTGAEESEVFVKKRLIARGKKDINGWAKDFRPQECLTCKKTWLFHFNGSLNYSQLLPPEACDLELHAHTWETHKKKVQIQIRFPNHSYINNYKIFFFLLVTNRRDQKARQVCSRHENSTSSRL